MSKRLNKEEKEILTSFEDGKLVSVPGKKNYQEIAKYTLKKDKRINIRLSERDLISLKKRAAREGIPYQTLIGSILHKYASGLLKEVA